MKEQADYHTRECPHCREEVEVYGIIGSDANCPECGAPFALEAFVDDGGCFPLDSWEDEEE